MAAKALHRRADGIVLHAAIPKIAAENFIRALTALHDFDRFRYLLRQEIKRHRILAHHGLGHIVHGFGQAL